MLTHCRQRTRRQHQCKNDVGATHAQLVMRAAGVKGYWLLTVLQVQLTRKDCRNSWLQPFHNHSDATVYDGQLGF